ncbi:MAG: ABC transporter ATP-binding protein [Clostridiaceae bacterium]|nr:ABC transporter ATP-binding protein [Clostridiaceae bacterium]
MRCEDRKNNDILLEVRNLKVHIKLDEGILKAVDGVSFPIKRGKTMGLVGESGCGKSLTSKAIISINPDICQTTGEVLFYDSEKNEIINLLELEKDSAEIRDIRGKKISMIFQEPMTAFSPLHTIGNQIMENILIHKMKNKKEAKEVAINMLKRVGIADAEKRINQYPHEFSGGMRQRAMIAMALSCNPDLLIADEPTTALDVTIQAQVLELMNQLQKEYEMAILFITHNLGVIAEICDEVAVMYLGEIVERASVKELFRNPRHPYTKGLIKSIPKMGRKKERLYSIEGNVPLPLDLPPACHFYERCEYRMDGICNKQKVPEIQLSEDHMVKCFLYNNYDNIKQDNYIKQETEAADV